MTPAGQIESTHEAFEARASLVHIHVRNPEETSSSDPALFAAVQDGIRHQCRARSCNSRPAAADG
jgi:3-keto-5-aminohexanoate cleavage enzyme